MRKLLILIPLILLASNCFATGYAISAVRIDGTGTATLTGTGTSVGTTLTDVSGASFTSGEVGYGIVFNGVANTICAYTNATTITLCNSAGTVGTAQPYTILTSTCYIASTCNGWVAEVDISTVATGGTYSLGFSQSSNNVPTSAKIVFTVTSSGYQSPATGGTCGSITTYTRIVYGTKQLRQPYPTPTVNDEVSSGGTFTTRVALSAPIFSSDTVTVAIGAGFYTDGSSNTNNSYSGTPTNNSTLAYSVNRANFNWTYPGWNRITTSTFTVRGTGFSSLPMQGLPLSCVVFTATDAHSHSNSQTVTFPTWDPTIGDAVPVIEYIANSLSTSGFTDHDQLTITFKAYPWIGDSTAVMDSSDGVYSQPTPIYSKIFDQLDIANNYSAAAYVDGSLNVAGSLTSGTFQKNEEVKQGTSNAIAYLISVPGSTLHIGQIVSGTANGTNTWVGQTSAAVWTPSGSPVAVGSDSNSCAEAESAWPGTIPSPCATINGGAVKMKTFNNASSTPTHADACGTVYLETNGSGNSGYYNWMGASTAVSNTTGKCWMNVVAYNSGTIVIDNQTGSTSTGTTCTSGLTGCATPMHLKGFTVNVATSPTSIIHTCSFCWIDGGSFTSNAEASFYQSLDIYITGVTFPGNLGGNGLEPFSTDPLAFALIRGSNWSQGGTSVFNVFPYTAVGNTTTTETYMSMNNEISNTPPTPVQAIIAFNTFYDMVGLATGPNLLIYNSTSSIIGASVVQNLFENITNTDTTACLRISGDSSGTAINNVLIAYNTLVSCRINRGYNETGSVPILQQGWAEIGNITDVRALKTDIYTGTAAGGRIGNWMLYYGTGSYSSMDAEFSSFTAAGTWCNEFPGLYVNAPALSGVETNGTGCNTTATFNTQKFKTNNGYTGAVGGAGNGNYNLLSTSPAANLFAAGTQLLPYDLAGQIRNNSGYGSAGAFEQAKVLTPVFGW